MGGVPTDLSSNRFGLIPDWTTSANLNYRFGFLPEHIGKVSFNANVFWQSRSLIGDINEPNVSVPEWTEVGMRLDWDNVMQTPISISAWGSNLTDNRHVVYAFPFQFVLGFTSGIYNEPRTYGLTARYEW